MKQRCPLFLFWIFWLNVNQADSGLGSHSVFCSCLVHQFPLVSPFTAIGG